MILQFGAGNFLRAFADLFVSQMNGRPDTAVGPVVVVQSTGKERADALNRSGGRYHVAIQGITEGEIIDETEEVTSIREAWHAGSDWVRVMEVARDPSLQVILSNTTEAGIVLDSADNSAANFRVDAPQSFPAKLLAVLTARFEAGEPGVWVVPCELLEANGSRLRELVLEQARYWDLSADLMDWIREECRWVNTLVDRIVPGPPKSHPLLGKDPLLVSAEPFAFWGVETDEPEKFPLKHPAIETTSDIGPFALRKVRILNGAHSALVCKAPEFGIETVRECLEHPQLSEWLRELLFEEIVPVLVGRCQDPAGFAEATLDRFRNPFLEHRLKSIALNHEDKIKVRLKPTLFDFEEKFGKSPPLLSSILQAP